MKRVISLLLVLTLTAGVLAGCGRQNAPTASDDTKLSIVTTIFPEYDWVREIVGEKADHAEITMLLDSGYVMPLYNETYTWLLRDTFTGLHTDGMGVYYFQNVVKTSS